MILKQPSPEHKLFAIYYRYRCGSDQYLFWSDKFPTEDQIVESLGLDFEPEKEEYIEVDEITTAHILE